MIAQQHNYFFYPADARWLSMALVLHQPVHGAGLPRHIGTDWLQKPISASTFNHFYRDVQSVGILLRVQWRLYLAANACLTCYIHRHLSLQQSTGTAAHTVGRQRIPCGIPMWRSPFSGRCVAYLILWTPDHCLLHTVQYTCLCVGKNSELIPCKRLLGPQYNTVRTRSN